MSPRFAVILIVLLGLQEFHPVICARDTKSKDALEDEDFSDEGEELEDVMELSPQTESTAQETSKRGWISKAFTVFKTGGKVLSFTTSLASLGNAIYRAIEGCCGDFPEACRNKEEFDKLKVVIQEKSDKADRLQLEAQNLQVWTNYSINKYESILHELNQIADDQEEFLQSVSPELMIAMHNQTKKIMDFIKAKNASKESVDFTTVSGLYEDTIDSVMNVGMPLVTLMIPAGAKLWKYGRQKMAARRTAMIEDNTGTVLKIPKKSSAGYKTSKLGMFLATNKRRIQNRITKIKTFLKTRYSRAYYIAGKIKEGAIAAGNYLNAALNIWMIITSRENCRVTCEKTKQARDDLRLAVTTFDEAIANITDAKDIMETSEVARDIQSFLDRIKEEKTYEQTYNLEEMLLKALSKIPFSLSCYTNKVKTINYIVDLCKKGRASYDVLYDEAVSHFDSDDPSNAHNPLNCETKIGFRYIDKEDLRKAWQEMAEKDGFQQNCVLNDPSKKASACALKNEAYDTEFIMNELGLTKEEVEGLIKNCPKPELSPRDRKVICKMKRRGLSNDIIAEDMELSVQDIENVEC
ncbi:uncharacterized protein LOC5516161 isoform X2 [Nematostella vectensis]|uniref:uncharacterized protein LOC5516161 isoform X2 n=1 Tax=Nematostella vectensis TaxID=45351 RepID=UPI0020775627|nr:uncharacterized protein LOC5516161 isoform X2 [Nematostella vectensis]